ncbi:GDYXXLXY domain-containing protein [Rhizobium sp. BK251]|uniref:GDYXXLXY domain-containing protein n=1 Tax=Rhizobium sp. BK251 TaxID=2512125 RepID=UPI00104A14FF|nr:GDYXXLXY domain-containing protein [Rhizobium sp. BK251]TCL67299.1 putative membrane-anchored protein [Rhizobium sp. BK251]
MTLLDKISSRGARYLLAAAIVAGAQTAIIGYVVESRAAILRNGAEVLLKTAPIDPRDFLRGDYVILNYDISSVPMSTVTGPRPTEPGEATLTVRLGKQPDGYWTIIESSFGDLAPQPNSVLLRSLPFYNYATSADDTIRVEYGIERYYVPEGQGKGLESARTEGRISVAARVSANGSAQIRSLLLDGTPVYEEPLY